MAHSLSAKKRARQNVKQHKRNHARKSAAKTQMKKFTEMVKKSGDAGTVETEYRLAQKKIDQLAVKRTIHKNTAARQKSRLARQRNAAQAKSA